MKLTLFNRALFVISILGMTGSSWSQTSMEIEAMLDPVTNTIHIQQTVNYINTSDYSLDQICLNDWTSSYSNSSTPLGNRFIEEYKEVFLFSNQALRGFTTLNSITNTTGTQLEYSYLDKQSDIFCINLKRPLSPQNTTTIVLDYILTIQDDRFTGYGVNSNKDYHLNQWYLSPCVYENNQWKAYSNVNIGDYYTPAAAIKMHITLPSKYNIATELNLIHTETKGLNSTYSFEGEQRRDSRLYIKNKAFQTTKFEHIEIINDFNDSSFSEFDHNQYLDSILSFINLQGLIYPHNKLVLTQLELDKYPLYGLSLLPKGLNPYSKTFKFEITLAQNLLRLHLKELLKTDPREDYWLRDGLEIYYLRKYIQQQYPDLKLLGKLAQFWGIKFYNIAQLKYIDQYGWTYRHMVNTNRDQALNTPKEQLLKFNASIASKYKAALGLIYLSEYLEDNQFEEWITEFVSTHQSTPFHTNSFKTFLETKTSKNIDWFFNDFLKTTKKIDYKISNINKQKDSIVLEIKNKKNGQMPVALYGLKEGQIQSKHWLKGHSGIQSLSVYDQGQDQFVLNYDQKAVEFNLNNNRKFVDNTPLLNKPLQIRLFKDLNSANHTQSYIVPIIEYKTIYDGLNLGININNRHLVRSPFNYNISPIYSVNSKQLTGGLSFKHQINFDNKTLYNITFGAISSYASFDENAFVTKTYPYLSFNFRNPENLRSNAQKSLSIRYVRIEKDRTETPEVIDSNPAYKIFNIRYTDSNHGLIDLKQWYLDAQFSDQFGKLAFNYKFRKLYNEKREINFRLFGGTFIYNNNPNSTDFSYALDKPIDYFFEYDYLGQFETSGLLSQQTVLAEGGFKTAMQNRLANQWMFSVNTSTTLWRNFQLYGDLGWLKNRNSNSIFAYDTGVRLNLITDYFEIYFPIQSSNGFELTDYQYRKNIRFIFTFDPHKLLELFRREWF